MVFIYIRHGEPIYNPDGLTELGKRQAEEIANHLTSVGVDKIFSSTSNRAIQTALPTARRLNKEIIHLDFANEVHVWNNMTIDTASGKTWLFQSNRIVELFHTKEIIDMGFKWYEHSQFINNSFGDELNRIQRESDTLFSMLGYQRLENGKYEVVKESDDRIALFAHQGFGYAFLSLLLHIPYPHFCTHFELGHAEFTVIEFKNQSGYSYPKVLTLSNNSHLIKLQNK